MIRIAIIDDDMKIQSQLYKYIKDYEKTSDEKFKVTRFLDGIEIVTNYRPVYDILFLDVQMDIMGGLETAERIREQDREVIIVFVTNMAEFAIKGYKVDAMSYVVKPVAYFDFAQQLDKAIRKVVYNRKAYILINLNNELVRQDIAQIEYIESIGHKMTVHTEKENLTIYSTMKKMEEQVAGYNFAKCNSGYLVNLSHVENVDKDQVVVGDECLQMSRSRRKAFMNALAEYIGGDYK